MCKSVLVFFFVAVCCQVHAQKKNASFQLHIRKTSLPVVIDGVADDAAWKETEVADDFYMVLPMDTGKANEPSEIRMTYDDKNLYLVATFYHNTPGSYYVESLRRDFAFGKNDNFLLFIDPFNNQTTGFSFGSNAAGAQWDGTMFAGGSVDLNWDSKWVSEVTQDDEKWVFEMALPFKSIRYKEGVKQWGINFSRLDLKTGEKSSWTPIPRQFPTASLAYTGVLIWDQPPPPQGANFSLIPYVLGGSANTVTGTDYDVKAGGDVKLSITTSLNLDLTANPDFSQVEVDRQVTNLDRFELFFPEKRQFFLENADLFASFGYPSIRPFFSRRIGLGVPIQAGARVSGNLSENWRLGLMNMQTARVEDIGLPNQNFGVISLQRKVFSRSSIGLLYVNKQSLSYINDADSLRVQYPQYNRNLGLEYNLASSNNLWTGKAFFLKSFAPVESGKGLTQAANIEYRSRQWNWGIQEESVGENYSAEVGFVPRRDYINLNSFVSHLLFPQKGKILSHGPKAAVTYFFNQNWHRTDHQNALSYIFNLRDRSTLNFEGLDEYVELLQPFDPTRSGKEELDSGTRHHWKGLRFEYFAKPQSVFTYSASGRFGGYYLDGSRTNLSGELGYRIQPYVSLGSTLSYNRIKLPDPWNITEFWLVGAALDVTFTNKVFFATLFQYNEQSKNFNLNSRFQWRYKPASDLFLVYTNNHLLEPLEGRNWSLTLKLTYWFNN